MARILVVEDEAAIAELIAINLRHSGFDVTIAGDAAEAEAAIASVLPSLVIVDWMLPGQSGVSLARQWRAATRTRELPIIMLTARAEECDRVTGLDAGADDYLVKPFSPSELLARIRAVLRRRAPHALDAVVTVGPLMINPATRRVTGHGKEARMNAAEFKLLFFLMTHPERVHSRSQLLDRVWGDHVFIEERTVDVHIKRLREVLATVRCERLIETVRGAGYRLADPATVVG
jgi:two-component system phosphate regulon response regulator PhoB